jgi:GxxExxY protein
MESYDPLIKSIIGCAYTVAKELGHGFSDEVYANALALELRKASLKVAQDISCDIVYDGVCVGHSKADMIVEERVVVDVTVGDGINAASIAHCRNDLKAARLVSGLIISFGILQD